MAVFLISGESEPGSKVFPAPTPIFLGEGPHPFGFQQDSSRVRSWMKFRMLKKVSSDFLSSAASAA